MSESEKCDIKIVNHPEKIWELRLSGDCSETIDLIESLPPGKRRYLKKRTTILD
jgi:hypothetical protein